MYHASTMANGTNTPGPYLARAERPHKERSSPVETSNHTRGGTSIKSPPTGTSPSVSVTRMSPPSHAQVKQSADKATAESPPHLSSPQASTANTSSSQSTLNVAPSHPTTKRTRKRSEDTDQTHIPFTPVRALRKHKSSGSRQLDAVRKLNLYPSLSSSASLHLSSTSSPCHHPSLELSPTRPLTSHPPRPLLAPLPLGP